MTITIHETIAAGADATVDFVSMVPGRVIVVWAQEAATNATLISPPASLGPPNGKTLWNQLPGPLGLSNQAAFASVCVTPASPATSYAIGNLGGAFATGGFELQGLTTDLNALYDPINHLATTVSTQNANQCAIQVPGTWTESEGFLFGQLQANQNVGTPTITGATVTFASTSRIVFSRPLTAADTGTKPLVTINWPTASKFFAKMVLLKPAAVAPPPTAPQSINLIYARAIAENVRAAVDELTVQTDVIEVLFDNYDLEPGALPTVGARSKYYSLRRAIAEASRLPIQVQAEIDLLQGTSTSAAQFKMVRDTTSPFVDPVTDVANGFTASAPIWFGVRFLDGTSAFDNLLTEWYLDTPFTQRDSTWVSQIGPDWSFAFNPANANNGTHTIGVRITQLDELTGDAIRSETHSYTFTSTGATTNVAPVVNAGVDQTITVGTAVTVTFSATDADGVDNSTAAWSLTSGPANLTPAPVVGSLSWTFTPTVAGTYVLQAAIADVRGAIGTDSKTLTVNAVAAPGRENIRTVQGSTAQRWPDQTNSIVGSPCYASKQWHPPPTGRTVWRSSITGMINEWKNEPWVPRQTFLHALLMNTETLPQLIAGAYDAEFQWLADQIYNEIFQHPTKGIGKTHPITGRTIRGIDLVGWDINHEMNIKMTPYTSRTDTTKPGASPANLANATRHAIDVMRARQPSFAHPTNRPMIIWCPAQSAGEGSVGYASAVDSYPGDDYVDCIAMDVYAGGGTGSTPSEIDSTANHNRSWQKVAFDYNLSLFNYFQPVVDAVSSNTHVQRMNASSHPGKAYLHGGRTTPKPWAFVEYGLVSTDKDGNNVIDGGTGDNVVFAENILDYIADDITLSTAGYQATCGFRCAFTNYFDINVKDDRTAHRITDEPDATKWAYPSRSNPYPNAGAIFFTRLGS